MKKGLLAFLSLTAIALVMISAALTQNDTATFNGRTFFNGNTFFKPAADDGLYLQCVDSATGKAKWAKGVTAYTRAIPGAPATIQAKTYSKLLTTANGSATVIDTLTVDGSSTGTALFPTVAVATVTAVYNDTVTTAIPFGYVKSWGSGNKTVTVRIVKGTSFGPASPGTQFYLNVTGY